MSKITKSLLFVTALTAGTIANAQWNAPDENGTLCVSTPAALSLNPALAAQVATLTDINKTGLEAIRGAWKFSSILGKATISFDYDDNGFYVQSEDDPREKVSICGDNAEGWLRVSVHEPGCPENKNLYIKAAGPNRFSLKSFASRAVGSVKFKKIASEPLPGGIPKPAVKCKM